MSGIDHVKRSWLKRVEAQRHLITRAELHHSIAADIAQICKGMGRNSKPEPCRRIDPNSPEGRAIIAALPP